MGKIQLTKYWRLKLLVLLLLVGGARVTGIAQELHTPYPIIFVHGIMGNNETWSSADYGITKLLKAGDTPLIDGGNIDISLNSTRTMNRLNADNIEDDVHLLPLTDFRKGDFYTVNFDVRASGETKVVHKYSYLTIAVQVDDNMIFPTNLDCYKENDVIKINDELMTVTQVLNDRLYVSRGNSPGHHNTLATINNLSTQNNQAAIVKQGLGLKLAIDAIIAKTNAEKVILVGHSMGGLAAREYLRNYFHNNVAKLVTIGTPHGGANISNIPESWANIKLPGVDFNSEAIRDLRTTYNLIFQTDGIYLYGGNENDVPDYYNTKDINCNNQFHDNIIGLNHVKMPYIGYTWIVSNWEGTGTDRIVNCENQYLKGFGDIILTDKSHEVETSDYYALIRGLDEPDEKDFAYEIGENSVNKGFITFGQYDNPVDIDLFKVILTKDGKFTISIGANNFTGITLFRILDNEMNSIASETNINNPIEYDAKAGTYYIQIRGIAVEDGPDAPGSFKYPYTLTTQLVFAPPAALSVSPASLQYYDVVTTSPKEKTVTLTNNGTSSILITGIGLSGADASQYTVSPMPPFAVTPEINQDLTVTFSPTSSGAKEATITISTNSPDIPTTTISLKGNGTDHETKFLVLNYPTSYNFGDTKIDLSRSKTFTIQNTGSSDCTISALAIEGMNPEPYTITAPSDVSFTIASGETKQITVKFAPTSIGSKSATLAITTNSDNMAPKYSIDLYGNGTMNYYSGNSNTLTALEYWFDDQYQTKVNTPLITLFDSNIGAQLPANDLAPGLHSLHLRYKDQKGQWSSVASEFFNRMPLVPAGSRTITAGEYWFDDGYANKIALPITPGQTITLNSGLNVSTLSAGLHVYHARYKDDAGQWSSVVSDFFNRMPIVAAGVRKIVASEYWFDDYYSTKVLTPVGPNQIVSINSGLEVSTLKNGLHTYHVRFRDDAGQWSSVVSEFFNKQPASTPQANLITTYRYWFDTNHQAMITVNLPDPVNPYQLIRNINTCSLSLGDHTIHFQFRDSRRQWSSVTNDVLTKSATVMPVITASGPATFCEGTSLTLTSSDGDSYLWSNGATTPTIQVTRSGKYAVTINPETNCQLNSDTTVVLVNPLPQTPLAINGVATVTQKQANVAYSVPAVAEAASYLWTLPSGATGTSTTNNILVNFGADAVSGDIKVNGHNSCGDGPESSLSLTVTPLFSQDISLMTGWNIISANVVPGNLDLKAIVQPMIDAGKLKKVMDEAGKTIENFGAFGGWKNNIGNLNLAKGYKVNVLESRTLSLEGTAVQLPMDLHLLAGWNIISYPCNSLQDAKALIQPLIDSGKLKKVMDEAGKTIENFGAFGGWKNNIGNFLPGKGYKVNVTGDCTLTIPKSATKSAVILPEVLPSFHFTRIFEGNGTDHFNVHLMELASSGMQAGDEIGIFDGKQCVGGATIGEDQMADGSISIPASANDEMAKTVNGFTSGHPIGIQVYRGKKSYKVETVILQGTDSFEKNGSLLVKVSAGNLPVVPIADGADRLKCYPNPFSDQLTIDIQLAEAGKLEVNVYDMTGKLICNIYHGKAGKSETLVWDGTNGNGVKMGSGTYILKANGMMEKVALKQ